MSTTKKIRTALVSVYNKDGIGDIVKELHQLGVELLSTGGTQTYIESLGIPCKAVEDLTGYPSILGGRVKTLHPKVFGGILARRDNESDKADSAKYEIAPIDLVIVDLYPFEATVASGASFDDIIEKIDIGGISLIRGAAKNFNDVVIVASERQFGLLEGILDHPGCRNHSRAAPVLCPRGFRRIVGLRLCHLQLVCRRNAVEPGKGIVAPRSHRRCQGPPLWREPTPGRSVLRQFRRHLRPAPRQGNQL